MTDSQMVRDMTGYPVSHCMPLRFSVAFWEYPAFDWRD